MILKLQRSTYEFVLLIFLTVLTTVAYHNLFSNSKEIKKNSQLSFRSK